MNEYDLKYMWFCLSVLVYTYNRLIYVCTLRTVQTTHACTHVRIVYIHVENSRKIYCTSTSTIAISKEGV
jgi:hypothetical protein